MLKPKEQLRVQDVERLFPGDSEMARRMRALDWSKTDVGPPETWPPHLLIALQICLASPFPMFVWWGPNFTILYNDAYIAFLGKNKHPAVLGRPGHEAWYEIWDTIGPMLRNVRETGKATWSEDILMFFDRALPKEEVYVTFSFSPIFGEDGTVDGVHCACTEVSAKLIGNRRLDTLRKLGVQRAQVVSVEEACKEAARVLGENLHDIPFGAIYVVDPKGQDARLLASVGVMAGDKSPPPVALNGAEESSPWPIVSVLRDHSAVELADLALLNIKIEGGPWPEPCERAIVLPIPGTTPETPLGALILGVGPRLPYDAAYRTFFDLVAAHIATAISDAQAYAEERRRAEALAELDRAKTTFFSNISHEFRTPLTLMLGPISDALAGSARALEGDALETVDRNARRLLKLVNSLLDFARLEAGRIQASFEPTDLAALTTNLASVFRSLVERAGLRLEVDCPTVRGDAWVDREMWEKIVLNLMSNAFKFTFEGSIRVTLRDLGDRVELAVADSGVGIPSEELPRIFERFHRVQGSRSRTYEGSGIGLALVQELARLHGGTVEVESLSGRGTTFRVEIPLGKDHLPPDRLRAARALPSTALGAAPFLDETLGWLPGDRIAEIPELRGPVSSARILLADDNADMRNYVGGLLSKFWTVTAVPNGRAALESARSNPPDLVLSDVMMPQLGGYELVRALRQDPRTLEVPVILLSARAGEESKLEGLELGADDYLTKPFSAQELLARVASNLRLSQLRKESQETIRRQLSELERLYNTAPIGFCLVDRRLRFQRINPTLARMSGVSVEKTLGRTIRKVLPGFAAHVLAPLLRGILKTGQPVLDLEQSGPRPDGSGEGTWLASFYPLKDSTGAVVGINGVVQEITERKRAENAVRELNQDLERRVRERTAQLEDALKEMNSFSYTIAHDLRAPLRSVASFGRILASEYASRLDPEALDYLERMVAAAKRMDTLIQDLLGYSRLDREEFILEPVALEQVVADILTQFKSEHREQAAEVTVESPLPVVWGHRVMVGQALTNLVSNAAKFIPPGAIPKIKIRAEERGPFARLWIEDNGIGIAAEHHPKLFRLFERLQGPGTYAGTGIGLAIVRRVIGRMGGQVGLESAVGKGSRFWIELPRDRTPVGS